MQGHRQGVVVAASVVVVVAACGAALGVPDPAPPPAPAAAPAPAPDAPQPVVAAAPKLAADDDLGFCVEEINRYRRRAGKPLLRRSAELEAFAADGARQDSKARRAHAHFSTTKYPHPYREMGENEIPWWPMARHGSVRDIIRYGLSGMWDEGPGGGHYRNLVGDYTHVGCGIHVANGEVTVVQDFLRPPP